MLTADRTVSHTIELVRDAVRSAKRDSVVLNALADDLLRIRKGESWVRIGDPAKIESFRLSLNIAAVELRKLAAGAGVSSEQWILQSMREAEAAGREIEVHGFPRTAWIIWVDERERDWA